MSRISNAQDIPVNIVGSSVFGVYPKISAEKTYNMYISDNWLIGYPGYKKVLELLSNENITVEGRGIFRSTRAALAMVVINANVYRIDSLLGVTLVGSINTTSGPVFMAENLSAQICIVDGLNAYIYNRDNNALTQQSLNASLTPNYVCYHNTYFLFGNGNVTGNGAKWYAYAYLSANVITESYELALQTKSDHAVAVVRLPGKGNNVLVLGNAVGEIQTNVGGLIGYQRVSTLNLDYGTVNVATIAVSDKFVCWLAENESNSPVIMVFDGQSISQISTDGIDNMFSTLKHPEIVTAFIYKISGHLFYQITFYHRDDNVTLFFDFKTNKFFHASDFNLDYHPARQVIYFKNKSYFISLNNGCVYEIGQKYTTYDENIVDALHEDYRDDLNRQIPRERICASIRTKKADKFRVQRLSMTIEQGEDDSNIELNNRYKCAETIVTESGDEIFTETGDVMITESSQNCLIYQPSVDFSFSRDGGVTYSAEVRRDYHYIGKRKNMMHWNKMGAANEFTAKIKFWGLSRFVVYDANLEITI